MPMMPCVRCRRFFKVLKIGVRWEEGMPTDDGWQSYKLWSGDLYECEGCGVQAIVGVPLHPLAEHYQKGYADTVKQLGSVLRVNDCCGTFSENKAAALRAAPPPEGTQ